MAPSEKLTLKSFVPLAASMLAILGAVALAQQGGHRLG